LLPPAKTASYVNPAELKDRASLPRRLSIHE